MREWPVMAGAFLAKNWKTVVVVLGALALIAVTTLAIRSGLNTIDEMVEARAKAVKEERDAFWSGEIAKSNAKASAAMAEQALKVVGLEAALAANGAAYQTQIVNAEKTDATLPDGNTVCLDADRSRLLIRREGQGRGANRAGQAGGAAVIPHPLPPVRPALP